MENSKYHGENFNLIRWLLILMFLLITIISGYVYSPVTANVIPIIATLSLFAVAFLHGKARYGLKNILIFFLITCLISLFFESVSIQTGFPFGHYYYDKLIGPRLFNVPFIIMLAYFGTGYASWMLAHILLDQYQHRLEGSNIWVVPMIATFIMVMWDVVMDPIASNIGSLWVWVDGGSYFGVPLKNFFGWFLVNYLIFQCFAIYLSKYEKNKQESFLTSRLFWLEMVIVYAIQGLTQLMNPITQRVYLDIYGPMAMLTVFTMMFVALLSYLKVERSSYLA